MVKFKEINLVVCKFLENGDFICMELLDIKWLMVNVIFIVFCGYIYKI